MDAAVAHRVGLADLKIGWIGDDGVELFVPRPGGMKAAQRTQCIGVRQDEVGDFDTNGNRHSMVVVAPASQIVENSP